MPQHLRLVVIVSLFIAACQPALSGLDRPDASNGSVATDVSATPPLETTRIVPTWLTYSNAELAYTLEYPSSWLVDDYGLSQLSKEILIGPPNPEPFTTYLSISLDNRTLEQIDSSYTGLPGVTKASVVFAGQAATRYTHPGGAIDIFAPYQGRMYHIATQRLDWPEVQRMSASFAFTGTPPTPVCEWHTASIELTPSATNLSAGQSVVVRVTLHNIGCVALGQPQYTLRIETNPPQTVLWPEAPEPIIHSLAVQPGQSDDIEFVLQANNTGEAILRAEVSFEVHIGYPGPAYWGLGSSPPVTIHVSPNSFLKPPATTTNRPLDNPFERCADEPMGLSYHIASTP